MDRARSAKRRKDEPAHRRADAGLHLFADRTRRPYQLSDFFVPGHYCRWIEHARRSGARMSLLIGALTLGFIFSLIALGVLISFRIFSFPDITADGSSTLGAAAQG